MNNKKKITIAFVFLTILMIFTAYQFFKIVIIYFCKTGIQKGEIIRIEKSRLELKIHYSFYFDKVLYKAEMNSFSLFYPKYKIEDIIYVINKPEISIIRKLLLPNVILNGCLFIIFISSWIFIFIALINKLPRVMQDRVNKYFNSNKK